MGFPENVLARNEKVEQSLHPHWWTVVGQAIVGLLLLAVAIYVARVTPDDTQGNWIQWIAVAVGVLIGIPLVIIPFLRWRTTHYVITTHRVMVRKGILNKSGKDITLSKITDVSFAQTLLDRMVGSGTLSIESAGDSPNEDFHAIPNSDRVQQLINRLIDEDANRRASGLVTRAGLESPPVSEGQTTDIRRVSPDDTGRDLAPEEPGVRPTEAPPEQPGETKGTSESSSAEASPAARDSGHPRQE